MNAVTDFFAMGGYALYVWTSYALTLLLIGGVAIFAVRQLSHMRRQTFSRALARAEAAGHGAAEASS